jgi:hypothetical protein
MKTPASNLPPTESHITLDRNYAIAYYGGMKSNDDIAAPASVANDRPQNHLQSGCELATGNQSRNDPSGGDANRLGEAHGNPRAAAERVAERQAATGSDRADDQRGDEGAWLKGDPDSQDVAQFTPPTYPEIRPVPGWTGYFASSDGRIYSTLTSRVKRQLAPSQGGGRDADYQYVTLCGDGRRQRIGVHQIIALTFHLKPEIPQGKKLVARHRDNNPVNNRADNVHWGTQSQNLMDRRGHGTAPIGEKNHAAKITADQVIEIRRRRATGEQCRLIAADMGITHQSVWRIGAGQRWQHIKEAAAPRQRQPRKVVNRVSSLSHADPINHGR